MGALKKEVRRDVMKEIGAIEETKCARCAHKHIPQGFDKVNQYCITCPTGNRLRDLGDVLQGKVQSHLKDKIDSTSKREAEYIALKNRYDEMVKSYQRLIKREERLDQEKKRLKKVTSKLEKANKALHEDLERLEIQVEEQEQTIKDVKQDRYNYMKQLADVLERNEELETTIKVWKGIKE